MKITHKDLKNGEITVQVETPEDLWYFSQVADTGDILKGRTQRKVKVNEEADAAKRNIFLSINVEKIEYSPTALRISGKTLEQTEDVPKGSYHTFNIELHTSITLIKQHWYAYQLDKLNEAMEQKTKVLVCVFDRDTAHFAMLTPAGTNILLSITGDVESKRIQQKIKTPFFTEIIKHLEQYSKQHELDTIILASPSFWKEDLMKLMTNETLKKKIVQATSSSADEQAISEVLKRDEVRHALRKERTAKELALVEKLLEGIAKKSAVAYGLTQTKKAVEAGAIEQLLVTDTLISKHRQANTFAELDSLMKTVDKQSGSIVVISGEHEGGTKLNGLGGIAAFLRYKIFQE